MTKIRSRDASRIEDRAAGRGGGGMGGLDDLLKGGLGGRSGGRRWPMPGGRGGIPVVWADAGGLLKGAVG